MRRCWVILNEATGDRMSITCTRQEIEDLIDRMNIVDATGMYQLA